MSKKYSRPPLRNAKELAEEFQISVKRLSGILGGYDGPKAKLKLRNATQGNSWFDGDEVRKWWNSLPLDVRNQ